MEYMTASDFRYSRMLPEQVFVADKNLWIDFLSITDHRYSQQQKQFEYGSIKQAGIIIPKMARTREKKTWWN